MYWIAASLGLFFTWKYMDISASSILYSKLLPIVFVFLCLSLAFRLFSAINSLGTSKGQSANGVGGYFGSDGGSCGGDRGGGGDGGGC
ncbi:hypothetical protein [Agaribacter flavus]|uniref:Uncharacterized protein n=1 Tax=Agaribacter flavus TaxID=1902781 RepID=A0ABV7FUI4_9ALTE